MIPTLPLLSPRPARRAPPLVSPPLDSGGRLESPRLEETLPLPVRHGPDLDRQIDSIDGTQSRGTIRPTIAADGIGQLYASAVGGVARFAALCGALFSRRLGWSGGSDHPSVARGSECKAGA